MNLTDLRTDFTRISGRSELAPVTLGVTNWAEVDKYINRGQNYLDLLTDFKHARARDFQVIAIGDMSVVFTSKCRVIQEVWVMDAESRTELNKLDMNQFRTKYPELPTITPVGAYTQSGVVTTGSIVAGTTALTVADVAGILPGSFLAITGVAGIKTVVSVVGLLVTIDTNADATVVNAVVSVMLLTSAITDPARPVDYTPAILRPSTTDPDTGNTIPITIADFAQYLGFMDVNVTGSSYAFNGVIWRPPADAEYVIETFGKFYTPDLTTADPDSWWAFTAYTAILHAALRELEVDYRNTAGANDWEASIQKITSMLSMDDAEEDAIGISAFEVE